MSDWNPRTSRWSVALSGGGHRAALFAVGALLYLADSGRSAQVDSVVSVSGGSITNGLLAANCDFATASREQVREALLPIVGRCATTGTVQYSRPARAVLTGLVAALAAGLSGILSRRHRARIPVAVAGVALLYQSLSRIAERTFDSYFYGGTRLASLDRADRRVTHVFCATELQTGEQVYFAPRFGLGLPFGFARRPALKLATAVQASAAFPVFPPRLLPARKVGFEASEFSELWLSDGGVYDNMGDEWASSYWGQVRAHPEMGRLATPPERLLVVNATANGRAREAGWIARVPLVGALAARAREIGIMHGGTTATRRLDLVSEFDRMRLLEAEEGWRPASSLEEAERQSLSHSFLRPPIGGTLVHIATSATWPLRRPDTPPGVTPEAFEAVKDGIRTFNASTQLDDARDRAQHAPLTLGRMDRDVVIDLLWHGYMLTMTNFAVFDARPYEPISRTSIAEYVDQAARSIRGHSAPTAESSDR